jgi:hypothetical protein
MTEVTEKRESADERAPKGKVRVKKRKEKINRYSVNPLAVTSAVSSRRKDTHTNKPC